MLAKMLAAATLACENSRLHKLGIGPICNPADWMDVLERQYAYALRTRHGFKSIFNNATILH